MEKPNIKLPKVPSYVKNVVKSFQYAAVSKVGAMAPATTEFATTNAELYKSSVATIRDYKSALKQVGKIIAGSELYDGANNVLKNALDDLKTGNLINKARENAVMDDVFGGGGDFDIDMGFDNSMFDDSESSISVDINEGFEKSSKVAVRNASHISDTIKQSTGAAVSSIVSNQRDIAKNQFVIQQAHFQETMNRIGTINTSIVDVGNLIKNQLDNLITPSVQFYTDAMGKLEEIAGYSKEMATYQKNLYEARNKELAQAQFKEDPMENMFGVNGTLDITSYAKVVMNNINKEISSQSMGMFDMFGGPGGFLKMLSSSPLSFIPNTLVSLMIPLTFSKAMDRFDKSLSGFFSSMISKFTSWQESDSPLLRLIGKALGVKAKADESIDLGEYNVDLGSLDKMTHRTINTVIPTYLRQIVDLLGGKAKIFDHTTGTFSNLNDVMESYNKTLENATLSNISDFTDSINERIDILLENVRDAKQVERTKNDAKAILTKMVNSGHIYSNFNKMDLDDFENAMGSVNLQGGTQSFQIFSSIFNSLPTEDQIRLAGAINEARMSKRRVNQTMIKNMYDKGYSALFDGSSRDVYTTNSDGKITLSPLARGVQDKYVNNAVDYLRDIKGILLRGIKVFTTKSKGLDTNTIQAIDDDYKKFRQEKTVAKERQEDKAKRDEKIQERRNKEIDKRVSKKGGTIYEDISDLKVTNTTSQLIRDRVAQQEELDRKAAEEGSIMYQMFGDTLIYTQVKNLKQKMENLASKPFSLLTTIANKASDYMYQMVFGKDPDAKKGEGLFKTLKKKFNEYWGKLSDWVKEKMFNPVRDFFQGTDEKEGFLSKVHSTIFQPLLSSVSSMIGVSVGDIDLGTTEGMKEFKVRMKNKVGEYYNKWNLGSAFKGAGIGGAAGLFLGSPLIGSVMGAGIGIMNKSESFQKFLFGDLDENGERMGGLISKDLGKQLKTNAGKLGIGAAIGAVLSTGVASFIPGLGLLGSLFTPFGAIGGALTGFGLTIAGTSDKFKNWLMGDLDGNGERTGGVLSKSLSNNLGKTMLKSGIGGFTGSILGGKLGALIGAGMSFIPGLGFLGSIMGPAGAIGGALMGMGLGIASSTDSFQTMLFGEKNKDGVRDKGGIFNKEFRDKFKSVLPKAGLSTIAGGLTFGKLFSLIGAGMSFIPGLGLFGNLMGPAGMIGGALLGLGLSITSSGQEFKDKLLGKKKKGADDKSVFDKMEEFIGKNILSPLKGWMEKTAVSIKGFFEESIAVPFKAALVPLKHEFQLMTESMKDLFKSAWQTTTDAIGNIFEKHVGEPFGKVMEEKVLKPLKSWIGKLVGGIGKFFGGIIAAPMKALTSISQGLYASHVREGVGDYGDELGSQRGAYERKVSLGDRFVGTINKFMKSGSFSDTWKYGKGQAKGLGKGIGDYFSGKSKKMKDQYNKIKTAVGDASVAATATSLNAFADIMGKLADLFGQVADNNKESAKMQEEVIKAQAEMQSGYTSKTSESVRDTVKNAKKKAKSDQDKAKRAEKRDTNVSSSTKSKGGKESKSKSSKESERTPKSKDKYGSVPTSALQRNVYTILIDNFETVSSNIGKIKDEVSGQLNGVGDNINRIRKMLSQIFDDKGGDYEGNRRRKGFFGRLKDFITSPIKFIGKVVTTAITAPFKILSKTLEGIITTAVEGVKVVSTLAKTTITTIGSMAKAAMGLVTGALKGFGHLVAATGKVVGAGFEFVGKTAFQLGGVIRDTLIEGLKMAGSAAKMFGSAMLSAAGIVIDGLASAGKLTWKGIKGAGKLAFKGAKGLVGLATGNLGFGKNGFLNVNKSVLEGGFIDDIKNISFLDPFTIKAGMGKSAIRVQVDNFEDMNSPKVIEKANKNSDKEKEKEEKQTKPKRKLLGWREITQSNKKDNTTSSQEKTSKSKNILSIGWNGISSTTTEKGKEEEVTKSKFLPMILGGQQPKSKKEDKTSAVARLGMKETALAKQEAKETNQNIEDMSTAIVEARDKKLDALRVKIVEAKDGKDKGLIGTITEYLPKIGLALAGLPFLLEWLKKFIPTINRKDIGDPTLRAAKDGISIASKTSIGKTMINLTADGIEKVTSKESLDYMSNSRVGKTVTNAVKQGADYVANTSVGKAVTNFVDGQVSNTKNLVKGIIDLTDEKQVIPLVKESLSNFFGGIAEKLEKIPVMKKTMTKLASTLRNITPAFFDILKKIPGFFTTLMGKLSGKGFISMGGKAIATGVRTLAKKFFPIVAFLEGFSQASMMNETGTSTFLEKLINGLTMALLDTIQAITMAGGVVTAGAAWVITAILIVIQSFSSYWLPHFTKLILSGIDKLFGTEYKEDYERRQKDVEDAYNTYRKDAVNKQLDKDYAEAQKNGYTGTREQYYEENTEEVTSKVKSKVDWIKDAYGTKEFSLVSPSTWKNLPSIAGDIVSQPFKMMGNAGMNMIGGLVDKITSPFKSIIDSVGKQVTDLKNSTVDAFKSIGDKITGTFTSIKDSMVDTFTAIPEKIGNIFTSFKDSLFEKFKAIINFKDTFIDAIKNSFTVLAEHPLSPFKIMNDIAKKLESFFFGTADNPTLLGHIRNGVTSILPDWMKPAGRGNTPAKDGRVPMSTAELNKPVTGELSKNKKDVKPQIQKIPMPKYQLFSQSDSRWGNTQFNTGTLEEKFSKGGCAPTVMAMLLNTFAGKNTDPGKEAQAALEFAGERGGIQLDYFKKYGALNGLDMGDLMTFNGDFVLDENLDPKGKMTTTLQGSYTKKAIEHLRQNKPLIGLVEDGRAKHYVIATHMDDKGMIHMIDPSDGKPYTIEPNKFFKAVRYGYLMEPNSKTTQYQGGLMSQLKDKGLSMASAFVRAVTNLVTKGIFSFDDLSLSNINDASQYGDTAGVKGITGISFVHTPTITQEQSIKEAKKMLKSAPLDDELIKTMKIGEIPTNFGPFKVGNETIVENGQVVQFPLSSVVGTTADGRPVFFLGTEKGNEFGLRYDYNATPEQFAKIMSPFAKEAYTKTNLRPDLAMVQSGLETGWGSSMKGNIAFNLKYRPWQRSAPIIFGTREGANSEKYRIATFANFPSMADAWLDHNKLLGFNTYKDYLPNQWSNPDVAIEALKPFAGDGAYIDKLKNLYGKYGSTFQGILGLTNNNSEAQTQSPVQAADGEMASETTGRGRIGGLLNSTGLDRVAGEIISSASQPIKDTLRHGVRSVQDLKSSASNFIQSGANVVDAVAFNKQQVLDIGRETVNRAVRTTKNETVKTIERVQELPKEALDRVGDKMSESVNNALGNMDIINSGQGNMIVELLSKMVSTNVDLIAAFSKFADAIMGGNNTVNKGGNVAFITSNNGSSSSLSPDAYELFNKMKSISNRR